MRILKAGICDKAELRAKSKEHRIQNTEYRIQGIYNLKFKIYNPCKAGFTLFEIIVVIFLLSLMLALVIPSFSVIGESRIKSDAKRLASILRYLNDSAISTKKIFPLKIVFKERLIGYNGPDGEKTERFESMFGVELQSKGLVTRGELVIFFGPLGASEAFSFFLRDDERVITVVFNPLSGRVKTVMRDEK